MNIHSLNVGDQSAAEAPPDLARERAEERARAKARGLRTRKRNAARIKRAIDEAHDFTDELVRELGAYGIRTVGPGGRNPAYRRLLIRQAVFDAAQLLVRLMRRL
jgi:hypothetical protein